jgi:hypothetical protein
VIGGFTEFTVTSNNGLEQVSVMGKLGDNILLDFLSKPALVLGKGVVSQKKSRLLLTMLDLQTNVKNVCETKREEIKRGNGTTEDILLENQQDDYSCCQLEATPGV